MPMVPALSILPFLTKQTSTNRDLAMFQWDIHTCNDYISVLTVPVILPLIVSVVHISNDVWRFMHFDNTSTALSKRH